MYAFSVLVSEVSRLCSALVFLGTVVDENFSLPIMICHDNFADTVIARQHALHAERDIVIAILPVRLCVQRRYCV